MNLDLNRLRNAVAGTAAAFRCITRYQPVGGPGDKVFPPTYEGGEYAVEKRIDPDTGERRDCVLLDSVQSQANRMELALLEAHRAKLVALPLVVAHFNDPDLPKKFSVTSLEAPHRLADALFRDSLLDGTKFRNSIKGRVLDLADYRNAAGLFGLCPTALVFGLWDSTGPRGGLGAKFQRALVSEIIGYDAVAGVKTKSRMDPAQIRLGAGPLYERASEDDGKPNWTLSSSLATLENSKPKLFGKNSKTRGKPSAAVHGNIKPDVSDGGFTISYAQQTTTLSLAVLRRLRFPLNGVKSDLEIDLVARTTLAALGLAAGSMAREDVDLRSRCHLFAEGPSVWQLLDRPGEAPAEFTLDAGAALTLLNDAIKAAKEVDLPWEGVLELTPSPDLVDLVHRSQKLASEDGAEQG
ncbi:MAG: type I-U CRISPR-associated RAMP protein Csb1/Cas7u [Gammaproteobacteria bacterium]|nr:type I-U CRISPR-associated RAMP protein Csb1/Cas7u [Gammaproteobacteria bacterium]MDE0269959.1 type I-U CRISPR-associated RAMP protein Csb1/Cas7u [Gammaproteobacteria bacterium]